MFLDVLQWALIARYFEVKLMSKAARTSSLSSLDPSSRVIAVRLPSDLLAAVDTECAAKGITSSEFLRGLVSTWVYGDTQLRGPDEGYAQARSMASQIAHGAVQKALDNLPGDHDEARSMLEGYRTDRSNRKKR
jgi:predicted DNA binding CopG/RHH family protein